MAILPMAMATMERDLLMPSLLQMPSLGGTEAMDMAGPTVSIGANLTNNRNYWQEMPQNNTHQTEPKWIIAESKNLITKKIKITILARGGQGGAHAHAGGGRAARRRTPRVRQ